MGNKINLEEVLRKHTSVEWEGVSSKELILKAMLDFGKQLLELAAENAKLSIYRENMHVSSDNESLIDNEYSHGEYNSNGPDYHVNIQINEKSILDTIKQVE